MNLEQIKSSIRWVVATFGGFIAGWFASRGWFSVDQVLSVLNSEVVIGTIASLIVGLWGILAKTKNGLLSAAAVQVPDAKIVLPVQSEANDLPANVMGPREAVVVVPTTGGVPVQPSMPRP